MFINILIILFVLIAIGAIIYIFRTFIRKNTKAKFAFASISALTSLSVLIVLSLLAGETPIQSLLIIIAQIKGMDYSPTGPNSVELVIVCFVAFMLHNTVQALFRNWDGPITVEQHKRKTRKYKFNIGRFKRGF